MIINSQVLIEKLLQIKQNIYSFKISQKKLETFESIYFRGKSRFEEDGTQNYLVFQAIRRYFKIVSATDINILSWKSKGFSDESIKPPTTSNKMLNPSLYHDGTKTRAKFNGDCLKQKKTC